MLMNCNLPDEWLSYDRVILQLLGTAGTDACMDERKAGQHNANKSNSKDIKQQKGKD